MGFNRTASILDAFFFSFMVGIGESYFAAFALSKGMHDIQAAILSTLPLVIGAGISLIIISRLASWGQRATVKTWILQGIFLQALAFLPLYFFAQQERLSILFIFTLVSFYFAMGFMVGPVWNFWMGNIVPLEKVSVFFSQRLRVSQMGVFLGLVVGGLTLQEKPNSFAILFLLAFIARLISMICIFLQKNPKGLEFPEKFNILKTLNNFIVDRKFRNFFGFLFLFYVIIFITSPFINPFFLIELKFSYQMYMFALVGLLLGKVLILPLAPRLINRFGVKKVFFTGAIGISPLPIVWAFAKSFEIAFVLQTVSGVFWALFEIGFTVIFFNHIKSKDKIPILSIHNIFNSLAILTGSLLGAQILHSVGEMALGYKVIFISGSLLRIIVALSFCWFLRKEKLELSV